MHIKIKSKAILVGFTALLLAMGFSQKLMASNFVWSVTAPNGNQIYILGSIHLAHKSLYPLNPAIMEAFNRSHNLTVELNAPNLDPQKLTDYVNKYGVYQGNENLLKNISSETAEVLKNSGFYSPALSRLKPWMAALSIQIQVLNQNGYDEEYGLDNFFIAEAQKRGLPILEIETFEDQMDIFTNMTSNEADLFLRSTVLEMADLPKVMDDTLKAWRAGDSDTFSSIFFAEFDKHPDLLPLLNKIIFKRNERMADYAEKLLNRPGEISFMVVGAGHLVGPRGILAELASKGYKVSQL